MGEESITYIAEILAKNYDKANKEQSEFKPLSID